ncbi:hypothetical protein SAMN04487939_1011024 [Lysobacter sp. yr284]|nr:hypothetical protein SAMN04487939_1011024 [Lysobacter sp. yr284]
MLAQRIYGDGQLWYVIAEANGLGDPNQELAEGLLLTVPGVKVSRNSSETFKPYSPGEAIGSTTPGLPYIPPPPKDGCGGFAIVMMAIVAIAVTVATWGAMTGQTAAAMSATTGATAAGTATAATAAAGTTAAAATSTSIAMSTAVYAGAVSGAAGSLASQAVGSMMGAVSFSWRNVAVGAVTGAVTGGIASQWGGVAEALANSPLKAIGLAATNSVVGAAADKLIANRSFSWKNVAIGTGFQLALAAMSVAASRAANKSGVGAASRPDEVSTLDSLYNREDALASNELGGRSRYSIAGNEDGSIAVVDRIKSSGRGPRVQLDTPAEMSGDTLRIQPQSPSLDVEALPAPHDISEAVRVTVAAPSQVKFPVPNVYLKPELKNEARLQPVPLDNLYTPRYGPYEAAYNGYIAGLDDASNLLHIRAMGLAGAVIVTPVALADMMTSGIINAPNNAYLAG